MNGQQMDNNRDDAQGLLSKSKLDEGQIIQKILESDLYKDFRGAFAEITGLPMAMRTRDYWHPPLHGVKRENKMCQAIARNPRACSSCLETQLNLTNAAQEQGQSVVCSMGMVDIAVPVKMSGQCIAFLHTGQILPRKPTGEQFRKAEKILNEWRLDISLAMVKESYLSAMVYSVSQQKAVIELLTQFAERLSEQANALMIRTQQMEPPLISKAKAYMKSNIAETVRLQDVAAHLNVSPFYFCRQFRKYTKLRFTDYLNRLRVERVKQLLQNPNRRISEVAFEAGFSSLSHFNRIFRRYTGGTPSIWREH